MFFKLEEVVGCEKVNSCLANIWIERELYFVYKSISVWDDLLLGMKIEYNLVSSLKKCLLI